MNAKKIRLSTIYYVIKQGFKNIFRNKMYSIASLLTMAACIFMFSLFYSIVTNFQSIVRDVQSNVTITVFMNQNLDEASIQTLGVQIQKHEAVASCEFISAEQAWEEYKEIYFLGKEELAQGFEDDNPLANSAHFNVGMTSIEKQAALVEYIESLDGVRQVNQSQQVANVFTDMNKLIVILSTVIILVLVVITTFLISNTIHTAIVVRSSEISIMKMIGSTDAFVQYPFIIEGVTIGFVGSIIPLIIFYKLYDIIMSYVNTKFISIGNLFELIPQGTIFGVLIPVALLFGIGIGFISSLITLRRYLRKT